MVLGDVAVRHPQARVGDVEQDVDGLAGTDQHGVLPDQVGLHNPVSGEDQEAARSVDVERVVHRVVPGHLVQQPELHLVADPEVPVDRGVLRAGRLVDQLPAHVRGGGEPVDLDHVVFPLDAARRDVVVTFVGMVVMLVGTVLVHVMPVLFSVLVVAARLGDEM